ncbi:MAG: hypothetical protein K9G59_04355 [Caulobacter sp.]|nr:hypothetical protein [Caulobacter sp.]
MWKTNLDSRDPHIKGRHRGAGVARVSAALFVALAVLLAGAGGALAAGTPIGTTWRLLDYVAVDYAGAVRDGQVIDAGE